MNKADRTVIRNVDIVDGSGSARYRGAILLSEGRIAQIGSPTMDAPLAQQIDGSGLVASPGFIDMHAHSDLAVLTDSDHLARLTQGCTLEVLGQDGLSYAPLTEDTTEQLWEVLAAWNGQPAELSLDWRSVDDYLQRVDAVTPTNVAYLLPHGTLRMQAMGWHDRPPTESELAHMCAAIDMGMRDGAFGLSAGLSYVPGMYAQTTELVELCRVVAEHAGFFAPHQRSYGAGALEGYAEMLDIGTASGCPVHLTHATMNFGVNAGRAEELLALVDRHRDCGEDVSLDTYPYLPGMTSLSSLLPSWSVEGGTEALLERLRDPRLRRRIIHELDQVGTDGAHGVPVDWDAIEISGVAAQDLRHLLGSSVAEAAKAAVREPAEFYLDVLLADRLRSSCLMHVGHEDNVRAIMCHPTHMGSSDGLLHGENVHPRAWGSFARYLGHYARKVGIFSLEEAVAHLTGRPARRLGLTDRGLLAEGNWADMVLFDPNAIEDTATFEDSRSPAAGITHVFVNGRLALADGRRTDVVAGRALRGPAWRGHS
ncbi:N-acyl-D-amino-acid deacylase family protein [Natronoglycomyces albus]|uniref:D-aminoacylase n=1 Tax=Natronoglycomyces albus TaxID=2811108 RepID=A0A895XR45_9ACTN|nr:D-aminoacylase [Natronoglycomyces albus]QSB04058.1 D-aminoacylase [Natronoglycomyces albus]